MTAAEPGEPGEPALSRKPAQRASSRPGITPRSLLLVAAAIAIAFAASHAGGLRHYAGFLSGSAPAGASDGASAAALGVIYVLLYFGCVVVAPVLALGAGILAALLRGRPL